MGYSYTDAKRTMGFFASGYTSDRAWAETGGFYVSPTFPGGPTDANGNKVKLEAPGIPEHLVNALLQYKP